MNKWMRKIGVGILFLFVAGFLFGIWIPVISGYQVYAVLSESMEPIYAKGSLIYVKKEKMENLRKGDVITFLHGTKKECITHRIIGKDPSGDFVITKGDHNKERDDFYVMKNEIQGKVRFQIPKIGQILWVVKNVQKRLK